LVWRADLVDHADDVGNLADELSICPMARPPWRLLAATMATSRAFGRGLLPGGHLGIFLYGAEISSIEAGFFRTCRLFLGALREIVELVEISAEALVTSRVRRCDRADRLCSCANRRVKSSLSACSRREVLARRA